MTCNNGADTPGGRSSKVLELTEDKTDNRRDNFIRKCKILLTEISTESDAKQYLAVSVCGLAAWACAYVVSADCARPDGWLFGMACVSVAGYLVGHLLERFTTLPPLVGMTAVGVAFRNFKLTRFHLNPTARAVDYHLRRIYPVIILTKGPLGWDWEYIKSRYVLVFALATLPWIVEWLSFTTTAYYLANMPWTWGIHLGSILASVSPAVVVPTANRLRARGLGSRRHVNKLVACAGGLDTAFTEGMFGIINAALFFEATSTYRLVKGVLAMFVGVALGVGWGVLVDALPAHRDPHAVCLKTLLVLSGGVLAMYAGGALGWGGTAGVAVMVCAGTAATRWQRRGWPLNQHPIAEVFRILWLIFEPMLFSLSGYYLDFSEVDVQRFVQALSCLFVALSLRILTAVLVSAAGGLSFMESVFVGVTWIPKAIVEAVVVRTALDSLPAHAPAEDRAHAQLHAQVIVLAIVLTSTLGSALTTALGPVLLKRDLKIFPAEVTLESNREPSAEQQRRVSTN